MGHAMLNGKCFNMYIHRIDAPPKSIPHKRNHQLVRRSSQKDDDQEKTGILARASLSVS